MKRPTKAAPLYGARTVLLLALIPVLAVRAAGSTASASSSAPARHTAKVTIQNFTSSPQTLTVKPGTAVRPDRLARTDHAARAIAQRPGLGKPRGQSAAPT